MEWVHLSDLNSRIVILTTANTHMCQGLFYVLKCHLKYVRDWSRFFMCTRLILITTFEVALCYESSAGEEIDIESKVLKVTLRQNWNSNPGGLTS